MGKPEVSMLILHHPSAVKTYLRQRSTQSFQKRREVRAINAPIRMLKMTLRPGAGRFEVTTSTGSVESPVSSGSLFWVGGGSTLTLVKSVESWAPSAPSEAIVTSMRQFRFG